MRTSWRSETTVCDETKAREDAPGSKHCGQEASIGVDESTCDDERVIDHGLKQHV